MKKISGYLNKIYLQNIDMMECMSCSPEINVNETGRGLHQRTAIDQQRLIWNANI